jgi:thiamine-phosphate pyrophosphorylase
MNKMPDPVALRMTDANANRAREALRVMEDYARFALNDQELSRQLKEIRHHLAETLATPPLNEAILSRDTGGDVGRQNKTEAELTRESLGNVVIAAGKRLSESLRVLEECSKTVNTAAAQRFEQLRYQGYILEQVLTRHAANAPARDRFSKVRLYVLITESVCSNGRAWETAIDHVLAAAPDPQQVCLQLREKTLPDSELLRRAGIVAQKCRRLGAISIINDRPDIALLADADGIHVGQSDLPCSEARKLLGPEKIIGVSTGRLAQATEAARNGATYIAVGPMFPTTTKHKERIAGPTYASEARTALPAVPIVAIGGITLDNVNQVTGAGVKTVAVCSSILANSDPAAATTQFLQRLSPS